MRYIKLNKTSQEKLKKFIFSSILAHLVWKKILPKKQHPTLPLFQEVSSLKEEEEEKRSSFSVWDAFVKPSNTVLFSER